MRVILIQEESDIRDKLIFMIESGFGAVVESYARFESAARTIQMRKSGKIDLWIVDSGGSKTTLADLLKKIVSFSPDAPIIEIVEDSDGPLEKHPESSPSKAPERFIRLESREMVDRIPKTIDDWIDHGLIRETGTPESRCRIKTRLLLSVSPLRGDIYIRLSETKYVKLFRQGDVFDRNDLEKYAERKGVEYLYIKRDECALFAEKYREDLLKLLNAPTVSLAQVAESTEEIHETVQALARSVGFTPEVQELVKTQVELTLRVIGKSPKLNDLFSRLKEHEGKYIASHSHACAYIACALAAQLKWGSDQTFIKLNLACFLHDITLENHVLASETSLRDVKASGKYTDAEVRAFHDHPREAAGKVSRFTEVPPDVDTIVAQHHERPDGSGFPQGINHTRIAPLTAIFIVAHDLTQWAMLHQWELDLERFLKATSERYVGSQFKKIVAALQGMSEQGAGGLSGPGRAA